MTWSCCDPGGAIFCVGCAEDIKQGRKLPDAETNAPKRVLMTAPHDGHPDTEVCPGCPHERATNSVTFAIPADLWMSANDRMHWAEKARRTRQLRALTNWERLPRLGTTHVAAFIGYPRNGKADPANAAPTVKALIDGMVDAGVWPDDDSTYVIGPTYLRDKASGQAGVHTVRLVLTAQDIPWEAS
jgi:crossover junction endodeoxyribonuclease RusA